MATALPAVKLDQGPSLENGRVAALRSRMAPESWEGWKPFTLAKRFEEAEGQVTFDLKPADGKPLPTYRAGQFIHVKLDIDGQRYVRHYTMSDASNPDFYRITIKRELPPEGSSFPPGKVSSYFIDTLALGATIDVKAPKGRFVLDAASPTPAVFLAGGVGVTPFLAMLNELTAMNGTRPVHLYYSCSRPNEFLRRDELRAIAAKFPNITVRLVCSRPKEGDKQGDYDLKGRINLDLLKQTLPEGIYEFFICGPERMNADLADAFKKAGVKDECVHVESFAGHGDAPPAGASASERMSRRKPTELLFVAAGKVQWTPSTGALSSKPDLVNDETGGKAVISVPLSQQS